SVRSSPLPRLLHPFPTRRSSDLVRRAWSITIRDGFGQTETSVQVANTPGQPVKPGSMGRALPGFEVVLVDPVSGQPADEGEICLDRKSTRLNSSHRTISYAVFCL